MINVTNLDRKPLQDLLRDKVWLMDYMKRIATKLGIDVWSGKRMFKFRTTKLKDSVLPENFPDMCWRLLEILDIYITCKQCWANVNATTAETLLFCEFKALEKKYLASKK